MLNRLAAVLAIFLAGVSPALPAATVNLTGGDSRSCTFDNVVTIGTDGSLNLRVSACATGPGLPPVVEPPAGACPAVSTVAPVSTALNNLRFNLRPGQVGSIAFDWPLKEGQATARLFAIKATITESPPGLYHNAAISGCPGDFPPVSTGCSFYGANGGGTITVGAGTACALEPGRYYVNLRHQFSTGANACFPSQFSGISYCSSYVQLQ